MNRSHSARLRIPRWALRRTAGALALVLVGCASAPPASVPAPTPPGWHAPLPHGGRTDDLARWWQQAGDPLLLDAVEAAQRASPDIAQARSRREQARATRINAGAALLPTLDASVSANRGFTEQSASVAPGAVTTLQGGLQTAWEIDLFGANRAARDAAQLRLEAADALWHDARVAVAADAANQVVNLRSCLAQLAVTRSDAASRSETARLTDLSAQAGFTAPATAALARASGADAQARVTQQRAQCEVERKVLVALTGLEESTIEQRLAAGAVGPMPDVLFAVAELPAQVLAQRPDVFNAEREVAAASADVGNAQAQRYPRLGLNGSIGILRLQAAGISGNADTWSVGPLTLSLPLFDGGRRAANIDAARARYDAAAASYRAQVRRAVSEVEQALVNLRATDERSVDARTAADGYRVSFNATQARYQSGLASLVELEDSRRTQLASELALVALQRERMAAWIALYRAAGGGWDRQAIAVSADAVGPADAIDANSSGAVP